MKLYITFVLFVLLSAACLAAGEGEGDIRKAANAGGDAAGAVCTALEAIANRKLILGEYAAEISGNCTKLSAELKIPVIAIGVAFVDMGLKIVPKIWDGDLTGAVAVLVVDGVKNVATTAVATGGGVGGAALGSMIFPGVGTVVGGMIGAAVTSYYAPDGFGLAVNGMSGAFNGAVRSLYPTDDELKAIAKSDKAKQSAERKEDPFNGGDGENKLRSKPINLDAVKLPEQPQLGPATINSDKLDAPEADRKPVMKTDRPEMPDLVNVLPPDSSIRIIPNDCTMEITVWDSKHPDMKVLESTYHIIDGTVSGSGVSNFDNKMVMHLSYKGTIKDNVITGRGVFTYDPFRFSYPQMEQIGYYDGVIDDCCTLNRDGTISTEGTSVMNWRFELVKGKWPAGAKTSGSSRSGFVKGDTVGRWHIMSVVERKAAAKGQ